MPIRDHGRPYDLVLYGATGYTGQLTAQHIATHLPTNLKWAIAGRNQTKLESLRSDLSKLAADRVQPVVVVCCSPDELNALASKSYVLIAAVGPYGKHGEAAFSACALNGTHYLDITGEVPWVLRMIKKYEGEAKASGAMMFPQTGIESTPPDLCSWTAASLLRKELGAQTRDVTVSQYLDGTPSGGTLATVMTLFDNFSVKELKAAHVPFALSPVPNADHGPKKTSATKFSGLIRVPHLGLLTTSVAGKTDAAIVERTWGLLKTIPTRKDEFYGPRWSFREYYRARSWLHGFRIHFGLIVFGLLLVTPLRRVIARFVSQPGDGSKGEAAQRENLEYQAIAAPDRESNQVAFCRAWYRGPLYYLTGIFVAEAALLLLEKDVGLDGGIYTPACLGQPYIDRLGAAGFHMESKLVARQEE